ncbi:peptidoglycan DD-metalloendopeptidase family protein [Candidatus Woesearchaeota archaeon]|nr:peptidoglycan DD-metalloendopeptidase family protein [Candidatus Woesearchaeota archaeon]
MNLITFLSGHKKELGGVLDFDYHNNKSVILDLSSGNKDLTSINIADAEKFTAYIKKILKEKNAAYAIGKYNEDRYIYNHSNLFSGNERRTIHLGIDLFADENTKVICPFNGKIHSFNNNKGIGDYGPTIIIEHTLDNVKFYTLYGHLSLESLNNTKINQMIKKGDIIGAIGNSIVNGHWPPHLHFQIIKDMLGKTGDFPGVASKNEREKFLDLCPDPNLILQINNLKLQYHTLD